MCATIDVRARSFLFFANDTLARTIYEMFTLQRRGELRAPNGDLALQRELDKYVPYEYILRWFQTREGRAGIDNRLLVIQSGTASGKSTTIPAEIFGTLVRNRYASGGGIICTQPRVLTAVANVKQIAGIPKYGAFLKIGETIGWSTQFSKLKPRRIGLLSATMGILTMQLQVYTDAEIMSMYRFILIDEAHERPLGADVTFTALKGFLRRNAHMTNCPFVVLMSATINTAKYAHYFLSESNPQDVLANNIIICNAAPSFERQKIWPEHPITNVIDETVRIIEHLLDTAPAPRETWDPAFSDASHKQVEHDDILVFFPGNAEISETHRVVLSSMVKRQSAEQTQAIPVLLTSATVGANDSSVQKLDIPLREISNNIYERRIILSTSVAETGKTFNTLRYVIDAGFSRENEYNPNLKVEILLSKPAPVSRITQRWGRVGRKFPGVIYPLYTEETYEGLQTEQFPEIFTSNLTPVILQIVYEQQKVKFANNDPRPYFRVADIDMLDLPQPDTLLDALERAHALGFIAHGPTKFAIDLDEFIQSNERATLECVGITKLGRIAMELTPFLDSLESIRMILAGFAWGYRPVDLISTAVFAKLEPATQPDEKMRAIDVSPAYNAIFARSGVQSEYLMRDWRVAVGDTFLDSLMVSARFDRLFAEAREQEQIEQVRVACQKMFINQESLLRAIEARDNICGALLSLGFDIYLGASILDCDQACARTILLYKRCIFDGYRLNIVRWDDRAQGYNTFTGLRVAPNFVEKIFTGARTLVFDKFKGTLNARTMTYDITANQMSVLDGFIGDDPLFAQ